MLFRSLIFYLYFLLRFVPGRGKYAHSFSEKWDEVVAEAIEKDPGFKVIWDDLSAFRANYAIWNEWAYLPRPGTKRSKK